MSDNQVSETNLLVKKDIKLEHEKYNDMNVYTYIPDDITPDTQVLVHFGGAGSEVGLMNKWLDSLETPPNYIIVYPFGSVNNAYEYVTQLRNDLGINSDSLIHPTSFSEGSLRQLKFLVKMINDNPACVPSNITIFDSMGMKGYEGVKKVYNISDEELKLIAEHVDTITYFGQSSIRRHIFEFEEAGIDVTVKFINGNHPGTIRSVYNESLFNYVVLDGEWTNPVRGFDYYLVFDRKKIEGMSEQEAWLFMRNYKNWDQISYEEFLQMIDERRIVPTAYIPNIDRFLTSSTSFGLIQYVKAKDWYKDLKNLEHLSLDNIPEEFYTDITYILGEVNKLRDAIKDSNFLDNSSVITFGGGEGIPGCLAKYVNMYFNLVGKLMKSLANETNAIQSVAQLVIDMDENLEETTPDEATDNVEEDNTSEVAPVEVEPEDENNNDILPESSEETPTESQPTEEPVEVKPQDTIVEEPIVPQEDSESEDVSVLDNEFVEEPIKNPTRTPSRTSSPSSPKPVSETKPTEEVKPSTEVPNEPTPVEEKPVETKPAETPTEVVPPVSEVEVIEQKPTNEEPTPIDNKESIPIEETKVPVNNNQNTNNKPSKSTTSSKSNQNSSISKKSNDNKVSNEIPINNNPEIIEIPEESPIIEIPDTNIETPEINIETPIEVAPTQTINNSSSKTSDILKTVGTIGAVGAGIGAGAYALNEYINNKNYSNADYEKDKGNDIEYTEIEEYDDNMTPYEEENEDGK